MDQPNSCLDSPRKKYFWALLAIEATILILLAIGKQFSSAFLNTIFRILFLCVANYCQYSMFAVVYSVSALLSALWLGDPIGLFVTGHGQAKTLGQNLVCVAAGVLTVMVAYLGYRYFLELKQEEAVGSADAYTGSSYQAPANRRQQPSTSYGGTNYLYQNPTGDQPDRQPRTSTQPARNQFQPFTGEGHRLS